MSGLGSCLNLPLPAHQMTGHQENPQHQQQQHQTVGCSLSHLDLSSKDGLWVPWIKIPRLMVYNCKLGSMEIQISLNSAPRQQANVITSLDDSLFCM
jgi:hypothetical protein